MNRRRSLTPEEREARSAAQTRRWASMNEIAAATGFTAIEVNACWGALKRAGLVHEGVLVHDLPRITEILQEAEDNEGRVIAMTKSRSTDSDLAEGAQDPDESSRRIRRKPDSLPPGPEDPLAARIRVMFWAIRKCGGVDLARDAFERAVQALANPPTQKPQPEPPVRVPEIDIPT